MKLIEIEKDYCRNIAKFFCQEYTRMLNYNDEITFRICTQLDSRLLKFNLIRDYKVEIPSISKSEKRDYIIDNVLENKELPDTKILIHLQFKDLTFETIEYEKEKI